MKTKDVQLFLKKYYSYDDKKIKLINNKEVEEVRVHVSSVSERGNAPYYSTPEISIDFKERIFLFAGESEEGKSDYIRKAIKDNQTDYIVSFELLTKEALKKRTTLSKLDFSKVLTDPNNGSNKDVGIYRLRVNGKVSFNIVMIRVKENGQDVRKYMDAYLASSDSCTYHDVKYTIAQFQSPKNMIIDPKDSSDWPHNLLIFGAPGTGKSYCIDEKIKELGWQDNMKRVTFYEDYSYEKFVGAYLPCMGPKVTTHTGQVNNNDDFKVDLKSETERSIEYRFVPGVFLQMIADAWFDYYSENKKNYVLVIEEINRANAASVFGDFFQLLDRDGEGKSDYSISLPDEMREWLYSYLMEKVDKSVEDKDKENFKDWMNAWMDDFKLPGNIYIWATMNSADQGVYPMDAAFKRRWSYLYKSTMGTSGYMLTIKWKKSNDVKNYELGWDVLKTAINQIVEKSGNIEEDRFVGPWFFKKTEIDQIEQFTMAESKDRGGMTDPLTNKLFQYLRQDVFRNHPDKIFQDKYLSMNRIREGMINGVGLNEILNLDGIEIDGEAMDDILKEPSEAKDGSVTTDEDQSTDKK